MLISIFNSECARDAYSPQSTIYVMSFSRGMSTPEQALYIFLHVSKISGTKPLYTN